MDCITGFFSGIRNLYERAAVEVLILFKGDGLIVSFLLKQLVCGGSRRLSNMV